MSKILITGGTGKIGNELTKLILNSNIKVRYALRNPDKIKHNDIETILLDFHNFHLFDKALNGCDKLFLLVPSAIENFNEIINNFVEKSKQSTITKIIFISALGIENEDESELFLAEMKIKNSGLDYVIIRPNWFMQNFTTFYRDSIKNRKISIPAGTGKVSFIDVRDIAKIAFKALTDNNLSKKEINLTGPKAINYFEVAEIISNVLNEKVEYEPISDEHYTEILIKSGFDKLSARSIIWLYQAIRRGDASIITNDFQQIIGEPPTNFEQFANDYKNYWKV